MASRESTTPTLGRRTVTLKAHLDATPGAVAEPLTMGRASAPSVLLYKVMGKMFAILTIRGVENVILKCDPQLADVLREKYEGVGHRSHLDRRFWISVNLDAPRPPPPATARPGQRANRRRKSRSPGRDSAERVIVMADSSSPRRTP